MITKIQTENGEHWAIVLNELTSLDEIMELKKGLIDIMIDATGSDLFFCSQNDFYSTLFILREMILTSNQACEYENYLKSQKED